MATVKKDTNVNDLSMADLLSYYEACNIVSEYYENDAVSNELEDPIRSKESNGKRYSFFEKGMKILEIIEKRLNELK